MNGYELVRKARIEGDFEGFDDEVLFKFVDGTYWLQDQYMYWYHYAYRPNVNLLRANGQFYLQVDGKDKVVRIRRITDVFESQINGEFKGWEGETVYMLTNGQVWQQCTYHYEYKYSYRPEAFIYSNGTGYKMQVEGTTADVRRIK